MIDPILLALANRVKRLRHERGITQEKLAERSGLHLTYIGGLETGRRNPTLLTLKSVACGLGVAVVDLIPTPEESQ